MSESVSLGTVGAPARDRTRTLFGQTMFYVAVTAGFFALGSYLGRHLSEGWAFVWFIAAFVCLIAMNFTVRRSATLSAVLLFAVGTTLGLAMAPTLVYYASTNPQALWQAGGPPRCSSPASERSATRPGETCPGSPGCASGRWWP
jgi:uncharacterized protein